MTGSVKSEGAIVGGSAPCGACEWNAGTASLELNCGKPAPSRDSGEREAASCGRRTSTRAKLKKMNPHNNLLIECMAPPPKVPRQRASLLYGSNLRISTHDHAQMQSQPELTANGRQQCAPAPAS